jgi:hypothetical protein
MAISNVLASGSPVFVSVKQGTPPDSVAAFTPIPFTDVVSDNYSAWNTGASQFTAPLAGAYCVTTASRFTAVSTTRVFVYKNGLQMGVILQVVTAVAADLGSYQLYLQQGDIVDLRANDAISVDGGGQLCHLQISKVG